MNQIPGFEWVKVASWPGNIEFSRTLSYSLLEMGHFSLYMHDNFVKVILLLLNLRSWWLMQIITVENPSSVKGPFICLKEECIHHLALNWRLSCKTMRRRHRRHMPISILANHYNYFFHITYPFQLVCLRHTISRNHTQPFLPPLNWMNIQNISRNETRWDAIYSSKVYPFDSKTFSKLNNTGLWSIILPKKMLVPSRVLQIGLFKVTYSGLLLRNIHQSSADTCSKHNVTKALLFKDTSSSLSRVKCTIKIDLHYITPLVCGIILSSNTRSDSWVCDHNVEFPKILDDFLYRRFNIRLTSDIRLIGSGLDIVGRCNLGSNGIGCLGGIIDYSNLESKEWASEKLWNRY